MIVGVQKVVLVAIVTIINVKKVIYFKLKYFNISLLTFINFKGKHGDVCSDDSQCSSGECLPSCDGDDDYYQCFGPLTTTSICFSFI